MNTMCSFLNGSTKPNHIIKRIIFLFLFSFCLFKLGAQTSSFNYNDCLSTIQEEEKQALDKLFDDYYVKILLTPGHSYFACDGDIPTGYKCRLHGKTCFCGKCQEVYLSRRETIQSSYKLKLNECNQKNQIRITEGTNKIDKKESEKQQQKTNDEQLQMLDKVIESKRSESNVQPDLASVFVDLLTSNLIKKNLKEDANELNKHLRELREQISNQNGELVDCSTCGGTGRVDCKHCDKSGFTNCSICDGAGTYQSKKCSACDGKGKTICIMCSGLGTRPCPDCSGVGKEFIVTPAFETPSKNTADFFVNDTNTVISKSERDIKLNVKGFVVKEAYLVFDDESKVPTDNKVDLNQRVTLRIILDKGFKELNGKVFPGGTEKICLNSGEVILDSDDLYAAFNSTGASPADALYISLKAVITEIKDKNDYVNVSFKIWDKQSEVNMITGSYKLYIK